MSVLSIKQVEHFDDVGFRNLCVEFSFFFLFLCLLNKICPFLKQNIYMYAGHCFW
jgi:hypothetical protein